MIDFSAVWLTAQLALVTTVCLYVIGTPLAWWLTVTTSRLRPFVEALTALPLVLPPTVMGFYALILLGPSTAFGRLWVDVTGSTLTFSFTGLVLASVVYSLPFMVQPLQTAFASVAPPMREVAATLRARPIDVFFSVVVPMSRRGFMTAGILSFAHTIGEFGVVLMVGGNIPGETRVISIAIYEHVETLEYAQAHILSAGLLIFSLIVLSAVYTFGRPGLTHVR